jgi:hypothetical protein
MSEAKLRFAAWGGGSPQVFCENLLPDAKCGSMTLAERRRTPVCE